MVCFLDVYWTTADEATATRHGIRPTNGCRMWVGEGGCSEINIVF